MSQAEQALFVGFANVPEGQTVTQVEADKKSPVEHDAQVVGETGHVRHPLQVTHFLCTASAKVFEGQVVTLII